MARDFSASAGLGGCKEVTLASAAEAEWQTLDKPMDKSILLERDSILFFADVPLYESELDDNGSSQLSAKVPSFCSIPTAHLAYLSQTPPEDKSDCYPLNLLMATNTF